MAWRRFLDEKPEEGVRVLVCAKGLEPTTGEYHVTKEDHVSPPGEWLRTVRDSKKGTQYWYWTDDTLDTEIKEGDEYFWMPIPALSKKCL